MKKFIWPCLIYCLLAISLLFVWQDSQSQLRPLLTLLFILLCPGMAFIRLLKIDSWYIELVLGVTMSIAIGQLVSMATLYLGNWSVELNMALLCLIAFVGATLQIQAVVASPPQNL